MKVIHFYNCITNQTEIFMFGLKTLENLKDYHFVFFLQSAEFMPWQTVASDVLYINVSV